MLKVVDGFGRRAPAVELGACVGVLCRARGQPDEAGQPADAWPSVRVPVLRGLFDQWGGVVGGGGGGGAERSRGGERGDQAVRDVPGGLGRPRIVRTIRGLLRARARFVRTIRFVGGSAASPPPPHASGGVFFHRYRPRWEALLPRPAWPSLS